MKPLQIAVLLLLTMMVANMYQILIICQAHALHEFSKHLWGKYYFYFATEKLRLGEIKYLAQGHNNLKSWWGDSNPGLQSSGS